MADLAVQGIETSGKTWRVVRLNVAERAVERGGAAIFNLIHCRGHSQWLVFESLLIQRVE